MAKNKKIIDTKKYTIEINQHEDGSWNMKRHNDGFNFHELLGILEHSQLDIINKMKKGILPDIIKREVVEPK